MRRTRVAFARGAWRRGHDVFAVAERPELRGKPDDVIFTAAHAAGWAVLTEHVANDLPLAARHRERGQAYAGLMLTSHRRYRRSDPRIVGRLVSALDAFPSTHPDAANFEHWLA